MVKKSYKVRYDYPVCANCTNCSVTYDIVIIKKCKLSDETIKDNGQCDYFKNTPYVTAPW
jgi:hypothetical protein